MASMYDVADLAGVSKTLVSRVINSKPGVSEKSRAKINAAMQQLNYTPNALARSLVLQKTHTIGAIFDTLCDEYFFDLINGIEHQIAKSEYDVIFCSGRNKKTLKNRYINFFTNGITDGVIIYGSSLDDEDLIRKLATLNFPFVVIENEIDGLSVNNILLDNSYGSKLAVEHLLDCGCKTIFYVTGDMTTNAAVARLQGYISSMKARNMEVNADMLFDGDFTVESGYNAINNFLKTHTKDELPDAFYFGADTAAFGGIMAFSEHGISVPHDVMVVGFDDDKPNKVQNNLIRLTTLNQPLYKMATSAVDILINSIVNPDAKKQKIIYYPELIIRESTMIKSCK